MLTNLLRERLGPYRRVIAVMIVLQTVQTIATLTLPTLNADIIDNGVLKHNQHYILTTGGVMLAFSFVQVVFASAAVYLGAKVSQIPRLAESAELRSVI